MEICVRDPLPPHTLTPSGCAWEVGGGECPFDSDGHSHWSFLKISMSNCYWRTRLTFDSGFQESFKPTQAQAQAQTQAITMTQVKTKFDANTITSKIIRTFRHFRKLFRREVIWIQYFHWPNIATCGKYPCTCVMPERYFVFTCCSANRSISASAGKRKNFDPCACAYACVKAVFTVK